MAKLILNGATSGSITLESPAVSGSNTLTLPASTGTVALTAAPTFTGQATIPTINLTGGQITFPATQSASADANTLDDYEEGTFTPSVGGNATYTSRSGSYTKIGRFVFFEASFQINTIGTGSRAVVTGLPFANGAVGTAGFLICYFTSIAGGNVVLLTAYAGTGSSSIEFISMAAAGTSTVPGVSPIGSSTTIVMSGSYPV